MTVNKIYRRMQELEQIAQSSSLDDHSATMSAMADFEKALRRIHRRAEELPNDWGRVEIVQTRGPVLEFTGRLLASTEFETRQGFTMEIEIYETAARALIAVSASYRGNEEQPADLRAHVVEPKPDHQAMRIEVMEFFDFENRAKTMAKKLGWSLRKEVE